jgi:hypothetical protein
MGLIQPRKRFTALAASNAKQFYHNRGNNMKTCKMILTLAAMTFGVAVAVRAADVTGKWTSAFDTQVGAMKYTYEFKVDGEKLTGKAMRDRDGEKTETEIKEGKLTGDDISFVEMVNIQDQDVRIEYKGKVAGDEMKLTRKVGDFGTLEIVAKREKASVVEKSPGVVVTGKWQAEFDTQIGKQKYTYEFKTDGDKLTGKAVGGVEGEKSDTEIKDGKCGGTNLSFVEMVKFQEQEIRVDYKGTIDGDEIKMTRQVGDFATEQVVAKRVKESSAK